MINRSMHMLSLVELPVRQIVPYENNPRRNENAVDIVIQSITAYGFRVPIIVNPQYVILAGHTRLQAALRLGLNMVPCIIVKGLTEAQEHAFRLVDNKSAEPAEWDIAKLKDEIAEIKLELPNTTLEGLFSLDTDELADIDNLYNSPSRIKTEQKKRICTCPNCRKEFEA